MQADITGRWPKLNGQIHAQAMGVQAGPLRFQRALVEGHLDRLRSDDLQLRLEADELAWHEARLSTLRGNVQGSLAQHHMALQLQAPLLRHQPWRRLWIGNNRARHVPTSRAQRLGGTSRRSWFCGALDWAVRAFAGG